MGARAPPASLFQLDHRSLKPLIWNFPDAATWGSVRTNDRSASRCSLHCIALSISSARSSWPCRSDARSKTDCVGGPSWPAAQALPGLVSAQVRCFSPTADHACSASSPGPMWRPARGRLQFPCRSLTGARLTVHMDLPQSAARLRVQKNRRGSGLQVWRCLTRNAAPWPLAPVPPCGCQSKPARPFAAA